MPAPFFAITLSLLRRLFADMAVAVTIFLSCRYATISLRYDDAAFRADFHGGC